MLKHLAALLVLAACAAPPQPAPATPDPAPASPAPVAQPGGPPPCTGGQQWFTPAGPEGEALPASGCYTRCDSSACPSGQVCRAVITNPCGPTEDGQVKSCMAAGQQSSVCLSG